jgi:hypothetical protein
MVAPQVLPDVIRPGLTSSLGDIVISDNLAVHKSAAADKAIRAKGRPASLSAALQSRRRPTVPTSIRSRRLSPSLRVLLRARAIRTIDALGAPSAKSAISSAARNAKTSSPPQVTDSNESPPLRL